MRKLGATLTAPARRYEAPSSSSGGGRPGDALHYACAALDDFERVGRGADQIAAHARELVALIEQHHAWLLIEAGDLNGAESALRRAMRFKGTKAAMDSALRLVSLLLNATAVAEARNVLHEVLDWHDPDCTPRATAGLAQIAHQQGDLDDALELYERASHFDEPDVAAVAACNLAVLLQSHRHDEENAVAVFRQAAASGHPEAAPTAAVYLGTLLHGQGNVEGARAAYQQHRLWLPRAGTDRSI